MAQVSYLLSTVLMGGLLLAIAAAILKFRDWQSYTPAGVGGVDPFERIAAVAASPTVWIGGFLLLVFGFGGAAVLYVSGASLPAGAGAAAGTAMAAAFALLLGLLAFVGAYDAARSRGRPSSVAAAEGAGLLGLLLVVAIAVKLVALA